MSKKYDSTYDVAANTTTPLYVDPVSADMTTAPPMVSVPTILVALFETHNDSAQYNATQAVKALGALGVNAAVIASLDGLNTQLLIDLPSKADAVAL